MARGVLWLGLVLLATLQVQVSSRSRIPAPALDTIPLQADFQDKQFQGRWYVIAIAGNSINKRRQGPVKMYSSTYRLLDNTTFSVTSLLVRNGLCDRLTRTFVQSSTPGQFTLGNINRYKGIQNYTVRVVSSSYDEFAILFFKKVFKNREYFKMTLYGRSKMVPDDLKGYFVLFVKSLGLTDNNILFFVPTGQCIDDD
ncbi:neutrophil gelatinase-associated lipocalin [Ailuropoda melanoleuca]|uniref:Lipocalin 2 n=1 Tax=Ailuropoda melanoleuca TaxID=9646 RepID=G1M9R7_AILME|nr:neutrophil gelatinase-associated lipocalin [Ailuropoda melanoleuca]XP_034520487.1 neutrophil gelatinase-associated lipocalin [Ailuropoda melanoleuca]